MSKHTSLSLDRESIDVDSELVLTLLKISVKWPKVMIFPLKAPLQPTSTPSPHICAIADLIKVISVSSDD